MAERVIRQGIDGNGDQASSRIFAGASGWAYATWKPGFHPEGVPAKKFLSFYATQLNSVEVNYSFRRLPAPAQLNQWLAAVPEGFRFSFKAPQRITHFKRLRDCTAEVAEFLAALEPVERAGKLGILLFQLPPNFKLDLDRLDSFLAVFPSPANARPAIAFEFRHDSWFCDAVYRRLTQANAALCVAEADTLATPEVHTAPGLACFRLRREGGYTAAEASAFAERFRNLARERTVYAYFKHEDAPTGALAAAALLRAVEA